jgi:hypothetical protein
MTVAQRLNITDKYTSAKDLETLDEYVGRTFVIERHRQVKAVKLAKVNRRDVTLNRLGERTDVFNVSHAEFRKFYWLTPAG